MFAFSEKQFEEIMQKFGLDKDDTDKIYSIGADGNIKKDNGDKIEEMFKRYIRNI